MSKFDKHILNCYYFCNKLHYSNKHKFVKKIVYKYYSFILKYLFGSFIPYKAKLGININKNYGNIECSCDKIIGEKIDLDFPSVGATENAILASCLATRKNNYN